MANTVSVVEKPIPASVSKDAYILGIQDNGNGQQALYRMPIGDVRGNGANDLFIIPSLIEEYGTAEAFRMFAEANGDYDTLTNITTRFFAAAAKAVNKTYTSQFYKFNTSNSTIGEKQDDNALLTCTPSTNTTEGTDDYKDLPLFACFDCNYTIDATTLEPVIHAIKGVYGTFNKAAADSFVGVLQMTGWVRRTTTETTKKVEYRAQQAEGFVPLPEGVRASDNSVRPFVIHAKYAAGLNSAGKLSSVSGVQPATSRSGSAGSKSISHDGQISLWRAWGNQYGGSGLCDIAFVQLMLEIKYAVLGSAQVMKGCRNYSTSYKAAVSESEVTRILLTAANAAYFIVGSSVSLGSSSDRSSSNCYNTCDIVKIASKEVVEVEGTEYTAINLDTTTAFSTTAGETYITPHPWRTGSTDAVLGNDGSPTSNTNEKEPFKLQGIELMLGMYEVPGDTTCQETATSGDVPGVYKVYTNRLAANIRSGGSGVDPVQVGTITKSGSAAWKYVAELNWEANDQEAYMLGKQYGGTASSSNGYRAAHYLDAESTTGWREWRAFGPLSTGGYCGFASASLDVGLGAANWGVGARALGTGGNRGEYTAA